MSQLDVEVSLVRKETDNTIVGFAAIAVPQTDGEMFCNRFPEKLRNQQASVVVEENSIVFEEGGTVVLSVPLKSAYAAALQALLKKKDVKWKCVLEKRGMTAGVMINLESASNDSLVMEIVNGPEEGKIVAVGQEEEEQSCLTESSTLGANHKHT